MNHKKKDRSRFIHKRVLTSVLPLLLILIIFNPATVFAARSPAPALQGETVPIFIPLVMFNSSIVGATPPPLHETPTIIAPTQTPTPTPTNPPTETPTTAPTHTPTTPPAQSILAVGDIANCGGGTEPTDSTVATGNLADSLAGSILTLGDHAYPNGTADQYTQCFDPAWGKVKSRIHPSPGNHDYDTTDAAGYFGYFGSAAGEMGKGWYSFDLGAWHIIELNSNCWTIDDDVTAGPVSCAAGSEQELWLKADLQANPSKCTLAYWHHPLFTSSSDGDSRWVKPLWQDLYNAGADVILNAHASMYERFAPQDPNGNADPTQGIVQFTAGTGGIDLDTMTDTPLANEAARNNTTYGVLKMELGANAYTYQFVPVDNGTILDVGSGTCH
jgi:hypothetical protein